MILTDGSDKLLGLDMYTESAISNQTKYGAKMTARKCISTVLKNMEILNV